MTMADFANDTIKLLESTERSLLVAEKRKRYDIVVGVPHHAPAGTPTLPCPEHRDSDENAGFLGRYLAERLDCFSLIACNSTIDVNKHLDSDYSKQIFEWRPKILIEIHGHGKFRSKYDVEISCGSADQSANSEELAAIINRKIKNTPMLSGISICGRFSDIYFKATKTLTITNPGWLAYHIELSSRLRKPGNEKPGPPPDLGYRFCDCLADAVEEKY
ncbi:conserved hypothetical protein [Desulfosarcina cetonica]|uniref:hypothetical protein n=1 Tax=Desulfosarcina cetonica TaxID=90730 RepID=UPI0012EE8C66|nr:hypothetical protein [Desulfosarcina cetonica]VTR67860.1 conserved hypothetical protein [Desulfosarcina cetonica]